jgi:hypothetical protein
MKLQYKCLLCNSAVYTNSRSLGVHIKRTHNINTKEYYDTYIKKDGEGICKTCGKYTKFNNLEKGYFLHCCKECISGDSDVKNKKENTLLKLYGVKNSFHTPEARKQYNKIIHNPKTSIINATVERLEHKCSTIEKLIYVDKNTYKFNCLLCGKEQKQEHYITMHRIYNGINPCLNCHPYGYPQSAGEKEVVKYIKEFYEGEILENNHSILSPRELDIYLPELKLAFEFDGTYWHADPRFFKETDIISPKNLTAKEIWDKDENKIKDCENIGITLYRIKEYDWKNNSEQIKLFIQDIILKVK